MKIIALEREDGGVAVARMAFGHVFGMQTGLPPEQIVALQRFLIGADADEIAELERKFVVGQTVNLLSDAGPTPAVDMKLTVLVSAEEVIEGHAQDLMKGGAYRRFVLLDESDLPPRDVRDKWRLAGDRVVA